MLNKANASELCNGLSFLRGAAERSIKLPLPRTAGLILSLGLLSGCGSGGSDSGSSSASAATNSGTSSAVSSANPAPGGTGANASALPTDPWRQTLKVKANVPGSTGAFGNTVRVSGDGRTLAVMAQGDTGRATTINGDETQSNNRFDASGAVHVYSRDGQGQWVRQAYIKARSSLTPDLALSRDGSTLVVGANQATGIERDFGSALGGRHFGSSAGRVFVFRRNAAGVWSETASLAIPDGRTSDRLGSSVAITPDGRTLVAGAPGRDFGDVLTAADYQAALNDSGAAYVFSLDNNNAWQLVQRLRPVTPSKDANFGFDVDISADGATIVVGANRDSSNGPGFAAGVDPFNESALEAGSVHVFLRQAGGRYSPANRLQAPALANWLLFGQSVSIAADGNTLAVGADFGGYSAARLAVGVYFGFAPGIQLTANHGLAYVYKRTAAGWQLEAQFRQDEGGLPDPRFGFDVALSPDGQQLAVGKPDDSSAPTVRSSLSSASGSAWVYRKSAGTWSVATKLKSTPIMPLASFGFSLSWTDDGKTLAVGAHADSSAGNGINPIDDGKVQRASGAAYLFELRP